MNIYEETEPSATSEESKEANVSTETASPNTQSGPNPGPNNNTTDEQLKAPKTNNKNLNKKKGCKSSTKAYGRSIQDFKICGKH